MAEQQEDAAEPKVVAPKAKRSRSLPQTDVPSVTLQQAMRVPKALSDSYAKQPATPLQVATALDMSPTSGPFRTLTGAAAAYGLTEGGAWAERISLTPLGRRAIAPTTEGDDAAAMAEAVCQPRILREFLDKYNQNRIPKATIAQNVLETMGVPVEATERAFSAILENARAVGFVYEHKGSDYVDLNRIPHSAAGVEPAVDEGDGTIADVVDIKRSAGEADSETKPITPSPLKAERVVNNKVFITHGKNREIVSQIKDLLSFGGFEPVVSVENETLAKSLPDKVMDDMRSCSAAVVHVGAERTLLDAAGNEHKVLNENVLIEIGAALALYGKRFILLVEEGTSLPSNLQGLYQARYSGGKLDYDSTMKLLKTFNEFKSP